MYEADRVAAAILNGATPQVWRTRTETFSIGDKRFVAAWEWIDIVMPNEDSDRISVDTCGLDETGELEIVGFSVQRNEALLRYTAPSESGGTPCDTGTYLFYPMPPSQ